MCVIADIGRSKEKSNNLIKTHKKLRTQATNGERPTKCAQPQAAKLAVVIARLAKQEVLGLGLGSWVSLPPPAQSAACGCDSRIFGFNNQIKTAPPNLVNSFYSSL